MREVAGQQDGTLATHGHRDPERPDGGQCFVLEMAQHLVLAVGNLRGLLLECHEPTLEGQEANEVARGPHRQLPERQAIARPAGERDLPWEREKLRRGVAQTKLGEDGSHQPGA